MNVRIAILSVAFLLPPVLDAHTLRAQQPTDVPQPNGQPNGEPNGQSGQQLLSVRERLELLESNVQELARLLGVEIKTTPRPISPNPTGNEPGDRLLSPQQLAGLEASSQEIKDRLGEIRRELDGLRASVPAGPTGGTLMIHNLTGVSQHISVNGRWVLVPPGPTPIPVPYSIVEAYLPLFEFPKLWGMSNWRWTGRDYQMRLNIRI